MLIAIWQSLIFNHHRKQRQENQEKKGNIWDIVGKVGRAHHFGVFFRCFASRLFFVKDGMGYV